MLSDLFMCRIRLNVPEAGIGLWEERIASLAPLPCEYYPPARYTLPFTGPIPLGLWRESRRPVCRIRCDAIMRLGIGSLSPYLGNTIRPPERPFSLPDFNSFSCFCFFSLFSNKTLISYRNHSIYVSLFSFLLFSLFSFFLEKARIVEYLLTF
jgi:hypothetical protein